MSNINEKQGAQEKNNKTETPAVKNPPEFTLERLAKDCQAIFRVTSSTFAGATCELAKDKEYTVEAVKAIIKKWLDTPIKTKKGDKK